ncbi:MAG: cobalt ECF transporter T component CbiQ [Candidatus Helarchaeota archaeon]
MLDFSSVLKKFRELVYLEKFSSLNSPIHQVNPLVKFFIVIFLIVINMYFFHIICYFLLMIPLVGIMIISRVSLKYYFFRTLFFITLFAIVISIPLLFITPGTVVAQWQLGNLNVVITLEGIKIASSFILRIWLSLMAIMTLIFTTPFANLIHAMKHIRIPRIFLILFSLTYRYFFLFIDEFIRILRAKEARSFRKLGFRKRFKLLGQIFGTLLGRSIDKSERIYRAMLARGYTGDLVTKEYQSNKVYTILYASITISITLVILFIDLQIIPFFYLF